MTGNKTHSASISTSTTWDTLGKKIQRGGKGPWEGGTRGSGWSHEGQRRNFNFASKFSDQKMSQNKGTGGASLTVPSCEAPGGSGQPRLGRVGGDAVAGMNYTPRLFDFCCGVLLFIIMPSVEFANESWSGIVLNNIALVWLFCNKPS